MGSAESLAAAMSSCVQLPSMAHEESFFTWGQGEMGEMGETKLGHSGLLELFLLSYFVFRL